MATSTLPTASDDFATQVGEFPWQPTSISDTGRSFDKGESIDAASDSAATGSSFRSDWPFVWPLCATLVVTVAILATNADLRLAEMLFDRDAGRWTFSGNSVVNFIYRYGPLPGIVFGVVAAFVAAFGQRLLPRRVWRQSRDIRRASLFLALLLVVGPGLIINSGLKSLWGRPRPSECRQFGGERTFVPVGVASQQLKPNSSFPSGHASIAFYWMAPGFVLANRQRRLSLGFFAGGTAYGLAMGAIRIAQGGHFLSDVIWAGAIVYLTGVVLAWLILRDRSPHPEVCNAA